MDALALSFSRSLALQPALGLMQQLEANVAPDLMQANQLADVLRAVPGLLDDGERQRVKELLGRGNGADVVRHLTVFKPRLEGMAAECRTFVDRAEDLVLGPDYVSPILPYHSGFAASGRVRLTAMSQVSATPSEIVLGAPRDLIIGRIPGCDFQVLERRVSKRHAKLFFRDGGYCLEDLGSLNGTVVNGVRLSPCQPYPVKTGDLATFGISEMRLDLPVAAPDSRARHAEVQRADSFRKLANLAVKRGLGSLAVRIAEIAKEERTPQEKLAHAARDVPQTDGLAQKMRELLVQQAYEELHREHFGNISNVFAFRLFEQLALQIREAATSEDLQRVLIQGMVPGISSRRHIVSRSLVEGHEKAAEAVPSAFGLRDKVRVLLASRDQERQIQEERLRWMGVTPEVLKERPWKKIGVPPALAAVFEKFKGVADRKLNLAALEQAAKTQLFDDGPLERKEGLGGTVVQMYEAYVAKNPQASQITSPSSIGWSERFLNRLAEEKVGGVPNGYWIFGGAFGPEFDGRIYLSLDRRQAFEVWRYLNQTFAQNAESRNAVIQYKMAANREGLQRSDSAVVYFQEKDQETIYDLIFRMRFAHPEYFKDGHPLFTAPVLDAAGQPMPGVSFGQHPGRHQSFGSIRSDAMAAGIRVARALLKTSDKPNWNELCQIFAYFLDRSGIDLEHPSFHKDGRGKFKFLISKIRP